MKGMSYDGKGMHYGKGKKGKHYNCKWDFKGKPTYGVGGVSSGGGGNFGTMGVGGNSKGGYGTGR